MNAILIQQLQKLTTKYHFNVDGKSEDGLPESFSDIVFINNGSVKREETTRVTFETYFITGFPGFDFHDKWNNGIAPFDKVMYGKILKETEKMYYFELHAETGDKNWVGWCPKKSCTITKI